MISSRFDLVPGFELAFEPNSLGAFYRTPGGALLAVETRNKGDIQSRTVSLRLRPKSKNNYRGHHCPA